MSKLVIKRGTIDQALEKIPKTVNPGSTADIYETTFIWGKDGSPIGMGLCEHKSGNYDWRHNYDEVIFMLEGEFLVKDYDTGETHSVRKGDMCFIAKGANVNWSVGKNGAKCLACTVPPWRETVPAEAFR